MTAGCCGSTVNTVMFQLYRKVNGGWSKTFQTPFSMNTQTALLNIPLQVLSNSDEEAEIKIAAVTQTAGEVNRVVFKLNTI